MQNTPTKMRKEIDEIPDAVERLLRDGESAVLEAARQMRELDPPVILTVARGSSDHACTFLKYSGELMLRRPVASVGPSVVSVYGTPLLVEGAVGIGISQSGQSPDIVRTLQALKQAGALTLAITNDPKSPLSGASTATLPICAGPELSVAATKTFVNSLVAGLWLLAEVEQDEALIAAIRALPSHLEAARSCDWTALLEAITGGSTYVLGRGPSWAIANEAALKFKETCQIHAESYSTAEVQHGPVAIVEPGFPALVFATGDAAEAGVSEAADALAQKGAEVFATTSLVQVATELPCVRTKHHLTDPVAAIVSFYSAVEQIARARGIDPDRPRHLNKVTETV